MKEKIRIGIIAPSSKVPKVELQLGVDKIRQAGFEVDVHPQCRKSHLFFAGTDDERVAAFLDFANSPDHNVIWCARGGHGVIRLLPLLEKYSTPSLIPKKKLLLGYSDATGLMEYVRRWGWSTLHAPMPSLRKFSLMDNQDWLAMTRLIRQEKTEFLWSKKALTFWVNRPKKTLEGVLVGGNLTVWNSLMGTSFQPSVDRCILFFEDVDESLYRIDRLLQQQILSGALDRIQAIVLGNFMNCRDHSPQVLKELPPARSLGRVLHSPKPEELKPLRKTMKEGFALRKMWTEVGERLGIPVAFGLPVGHGPGISPLPLGAGYQLKPSGHLALRHWSWISGT